MKEQFFIKISIDILTQVYNILIFYFLTLNLNNQIIGIIGYTHSLIGFFLTITSVGLELIYLQKNADQNFHKYFSVFFFLKTLKVIIAYTPLLIFIFAGEQDIETLTFMFLTTAAYLITSYTTIFAKNLEAKQKMIKTSVILFLYQFIKNTMILFIILNIKNVSNPLYFLGLIYLSSAGIQFVITIILSRNEFKLCKIDKEILKNYVKLTKPYFLYFLMTGFVNQFDKILLDLSYGHTELALYYVVETNIIAIFLLISSQLSILFYSYLPSEFENNNIKTIRTVTHTTEKYSSILFLSLVLIVQMNSDKLFNIFLPAYSDAAIYLKILIFIPYLVGINQPYSSHLIPSKNEKVLSKYFIIKSAIWVLIILLIVPSKNIFIISLGYGGLGLSFMIILSYCIDFFFYRYFSKKIGISSNYKILTHLLFALISFIIVQFLFKTIFLEFIVNDIIFVLLSSLSILGLFLLQLILFKVLNKNDKFFLLNLFKLRNYWEIFLEEISQ